MQTYSFFTYLLSLLAIVMMTMLCVCVDFRYVAPKAPHLSTAEHQFNCSLSNFTVITTLQYIWMLSTVHVLFVFITENPNPLLHIDMSQTIQGFPLSTWIDTAVTELNVVLNV